jgi:hypothetical protein
MWQQCLKATDLASWMPGELQARLPSNVETRRLPEARWQRRVVVRSSRLLRFWVKTPNTNSEIGTTGLARARQAGPSHRGSDVLQEAIKKPLLHVLRLLAIERREMVPCMQPKPLRPRTDDGDRDSRGFGAPLLARRLLPPAAARNYRCARLALVNIARRLAGLVAPYDRCRRYDDGMLSSKARNP